MDMDGPKLISFRLSSWFLIESIFRSLFLAELRMNHGALLNFLQMLLRATYGISKLLKAVSPQTVDAYIMIESKHFL